MAKSERPAERTPEQQKTELVEKIKRVSVDFFLDRAKKDRAEGLDSRLNHLFAVTEKRMNGLLEQLQVIELESIPVLPEEEPLPLALPNPTGPTGPTGPPLIELGEN